MTPDPWLLLDSGSCDYAYNMAVDETLLAASASLAAPVLRFYGWTQPAASFGYFQHYADIAAVTHLRPLVRRPTGGGLVPHDADWTYSVAVPPTHPWYELRAAESYRRVHEWLRLAFAMLAVQTELAPCCRKEIPGQCFAGYEQHDLLWFGRKIAGAAQRRTKSGLLIQGSIQPQPPAVTRQQWQSAMQRAGEQHWAIQWKTWSMPASISSHAEQLSAEKYSHPSYNTKR